MYSNKILILLFLFISATACVFSQNEEDSTRTKSKHHWSEWKKEFDFVRDTFHGKPTISLQYGFSEMNLKGAQRNFANPALLELKIGYTKEKPTEENDKIINYKYSYLQLSYFSTELANASITPDVQSKMWRVGFSKATGYGYTFGSSTFIPYYSSGFMWSRVEILPDKVQTFAPLPPSGLEDYDQTFRFGTSSEAGLRFKFANHYVLDAGYERSIIFRRHLFGKWIMSGIIESIAQSVVDKFVDEVLDSTPKAAPVVNFFLKNALSYGIYELRQSKMNWPFNTEPPLSYDQFKLGVTFVF
jgi:hypothetical protein